MTLAAALSIASGGLANVNFQLGVVAQNVTNAGTPNYVTEVATQQSLTVHGQPATGSRPGRPAARSIPRCRAR